jgi:hypothetical protein
LVHVELLGSAFAVESNDSRWDRFFSHLWLPVPPAGGDPVTATVRVDGDSCELTVGDAPSFVHESAWHAAEALRFAMVETAVKEARDAVVLHGACLERGGRCVVLVGRSGSGKTTLTLEMVQRGWTYLSDDLAPLDKNSGRVRPAPKPLGIKDPGRWVELAHYWDGFEWPGPPRHHFYVGAGSMPVYAGPPAEAGLFVFPTYRPGSPGLLQEVTAAESATLCAGSLRSVDPEALRVVLEATGPVPSVRLEYPSAGVALALLAPLLDGFARGAG